LHKRFLKRSVGQLDPIFYHNMTRVGSLLGSKK
jgi:hypothetical protein